MFRHCTGLTSITIPNSVTHLEYYVFEGCTGLKNVTIPNSVSSMGDRVFAGCTGLTNVTTRIIAEQMFFGCTGLKRFTIPANLTRITEGAFWDCTGLTNVTIHNNVAWVGESSLRGCTGLTSIIIPNSVTFIGESAFAGCANLTGLYFEGNAPGEYEPFNGSPFVTAFHRSETTGWGAAFADRPTALWVERPSYADWAVSTGLNAQFPAASGEGDDADGDGFTNGDEWFASTDPTQSASRLELELTSRPADLTASDQTPVPAGQRAVYFRSVPGRYYGVQSTTNLSGPWTLQAVRIASTSQTRFVLPASGPQAFYRVLALP